MKPRDQNDLKLGTVIVLDIASKPIDFGFKRSGRGHLSKFLCSKKRIVHSGTKVRDTHCVVMLQSNGSVKEPNISIYFFFPPIS